MKKILLISAAVLGLAAFGSMAQAADSLTSTNKGNVANLGAIVNATNDHSINSSNGNQAGGASNSFAATLPRGVALPVNPGKQTTLNSGNVINAGVIGNATNVHSYGSSNANAAIGASNSVSLNVGQKAPK